MTYRGPQDRIFASQRGTPLDLARTSFVGFAIGNPWKVVRIEVPRMTFLGIIRGSKSEIRRFEAKVNHSYKVV